ncbi:hypothetical protein A1Q2_04656 [Trichosporon asahii var. asahii CBS 8904]|uniref:DUF3253 domain-containing protein n=1 Tax=Trichosporon asahii var. asahii (strain CBS 8904) TaxID=1220162 RepID=K1VAI3_TRIAC|nr:hypothetical protein A1Q2_04656 [Trichosporon asahii var. asahii CBS 8904]
MPSPPRTPTGHHITVHGRRWRASDPAIPPKLRQELVNSLMAGRRGVRSDGAKGSVARRKVQDAKVALGERGVEWWIPTDASQDGGVEEGTATKEDEKTDGEGDKGTEDRENKLWWQLPWKRDGLHARIDSTIRSLCRAREHGTVCPSEVSRAVAGDATEDWRELMPLVRERAEGLMRKGQIEICQKGERVEPGEYKGPIRLRVAAGIDEPEGNEEGAEDADDSGDEGEKEGGQGGEDGVNGVNGGDKDARDEETSDEGTTAKGKNKEEPVAQTTRGGKRQHTPDPPEAESDSLPLRSGKRRR